MTISDALAAALNDRYRLEREIGRGGMATVYLAHDLKHDRSVAVKVLDPELASTLASERFLREIGVAARLTHPHILPLYDSGRVANTLYYVMPFIDGESLRDRLTREGPLPTEDAVAIVREVADALQHAHEAGVVHRDIKPENILLSRGHALVADFGIARAVNAAANVRLTATGMSVGTPAYMSPEQASGMPGVDGRSDVYSLACVAYEMFGGNPPFTGASAMAIMARHALDTPLPLRTVRSTLPEAVDTVLVKALAKVPSDRYATPMQLADALSRAYTEGATPALPRPVAGARQSTRMATTAVALLTVVALAVVLTRGRLWGGANIASLAVLPFETTTADSAQDYFTSGMTDAMRGALGQVGSLRVLAGATRLYKSAGKADSVIARELNVDALVRATVDHLHDSVHLQVRLIRVRPSERLLWSRSYDGPIATVLSMHSTAARDIARTVSAELTPSDEATLARARPVNAESYQAFLRGMAVLDRAANTEQARALPYFQAAVDKNAADPLAYAGLAMAYAEIAHGPEPTADAMVYGRAAALRAIALDSMLAEGWAALAEIKLYLEWDWAGAERAFLRAIDLNPNVANTYYHYAWYLALFDRMEDAVTMHKRAQELDPFAPVNTAWLGQLYNMAGRYDEGAAEGRKAMAMPGRGALPRVALGSAYVEQGRYDEAIKLLDSATTLFPGFVNHLGYAYDRAGKPQETRRLLANLERLPVTPIRALNRALLNGTLGNNDEYFRWLAFEPHHAWVPWVRVMRGWAPPGIRKDPRFQQLMRRMNLPRARPQLP